MPSPQNHVIKLDPALGRRLKAWCAMNDRTMRERVAELVELSLTSQPPKSPSGFPTTKEKAKPRPRQQRLPGTH